MGYLTVVYSEDPKAVYQAVSREDRSSSKVVGIYRFTSKQSTCSGYCTNQKVSGWKRHPKQGHMIHTCGKRNARWLKFLTGALFDHLGRNLLPEKLTPRLFRNPNTW